MSLLVPVLYILLLLAYTNASDSVVRLGRYEENEININARVGQQLRNQNQCLICPRDDMPMKPEVEPLPNSPGLTCGMVQEQEASQITSDALYCEELGSILNHRCCDRSSFPKTYECSTNVRSMLLGDDFYDPTVAPIQGVGGTMNVLDVETLITFIAVEDLDVRTSTLKIFVEVSLTWNDPRLRWDVDETNCATYIRARADASMEETEIWVPSFDLMNRATSLQDMNAKKALVKPDGTVTWDRTGALTAICTFIGLRRIPFDNLGCRLYFGDSDDEVLDIDYIPKENGYSYSNNTKGLGFYPYQINYAEFKNIKEKARTGYITEWGGAHSFYVDLYFQRSTYHYVIFSILPSLFFTFMSFGQFALDVTAGERLAFSITIVLITVTQTIVTAGLLPMCNEKLWLNSFNLVSMMFTFAGIIETIIVLVLITVLSPRIKKYTIKKEEGEEGERDGLLSNNIDAKINEDFHQIEMEDDRRSTDSNNNNNNNNEPENNNISFVEATATATATATHGQNDNKLVNAADEKGERNWKDIRIIRAFTTRPNGIKELVQRIDLVCLLMLPFSYIIYITVMFAFNYKWDDNPDDFFEG